MAGRGGLTRRRVLGGGAGAAALTAGGAGLPMPAIAQARRRVRFAAGGVVLYSYLPFFICVGQNLFPRHGIEPDITVFPAGTRAMQAVLGGGADVACGYYEHTIQVAAHGAAQAQTAAHGAAQGQVAANGTAQAQVAADGAAQGTIQGAAPGQGPAPGARLTAFVLQARNSGLALGVRQDLADRIRTPADLRGCRIGVSAPGSATHVFARLVLAKAGLAPTDATPVAVGSTQTAMAALERGDVDALSLFDPIMAELELRRRVRILVDARGADGTRAVFGGAYASGSLYAEAGWLERDPDSARAAAAAIVDALRFLRGATPEAAMGVLEKGMCFVGTEVCNAGFARNQDAFDHGGQVTPEMARTVHAALASSDPVVAAARIDLGATYTDRFVAA